jgi:hypothetical protein
MSFSTMDEENEPLSVPAFEPVGGEEDLDIPAFLKKRTY